MTDLQPSRAKLTYGLIDQFYEIIKHGNYFVTACKLCNVDESTAYRWMRAGEKAPDVDPPNIYRLFWRKVNEADAASEVYAVEMIRNAMPSDARAAMSFLSRRHSARWTERKYIRIEVERQIEQICRVLQERLPEDIFLTVLREMASAQQEVLDGDDVIEM